MDALDEKANKYLTKAYLKFMSATRNNGGSSKKVLLLESVGTGLLLNLFMVEQVLVKMRVWVGLILVTPVLVSLHFFAARVFLNGIAW